MAVSLLGVIAWTVLEGQFQQHKSTKASATAGVNDKSQAPTLVAAGDIADCKGGAARSAEIVGSLISGDQDVKVAALGDLAYEEGTAEDFAECYEPTWGGFKNLTYPAVGNHEYKTKGAKPYYDYFGSRAGERGKGYYSYDYGGWHIIVLNSNCDEVGGCEADSAQGRWLERDLETHRTLCSLAYWHHPRFSSGEHGNEKDMSAFWGILGKAGVEIVLSGHDHNYERFQAMDSKGNLDPERGIVQFVVGTGGRKLRSVGKPEKGSAVVNDEEHGVLTLRLFASRVDWDFLSSGGSFEDSGSLACHE